MFGAFLLVTLLTTTYCVPVEVNVQEQNPQPVIPQEVAQEETKLSNPIEPQLPPQENPLPPQEEVAPPPEDLAASPDANPESQPGTSDLDTDATFWGGYSGWGYRRPYYGWGSYYGSPWRRWGGYGYGGRSYGGWGWGRGWGWGGRGWGGRYWG